MKQKVVVFSPHPDDDLIGCGGSLINHLKEGADVLVVYLTSGELGTLGYIPKKLAKIRETEARSAAKIIGLKKLIFLRQPDSCLKFTKKLLAKVVKIISHEKPNIIYIPHAKENNADHVATYKIVKSAVKNVLTKKGNRIAPIILEYEIWTTLQNYNYIEDISRSMNLKILALKKHKTQLISKNYAEAAKNLARYRGIMTGKGNYVEVFKMIN
ncbi:MAG: PIG-L family deacetylase [Patescibacteria group bacterium]|nr:PIG-L family deacetylase [Patescibacteria group bacterium]MDD5121563.1 PIG-L family deacetylase [Patescibacteria group bacterium]MDD5222237.1 PIG-L family deacetylase [Patescibacteria group bacterium]MDD5396273.1 PIG-L family deacetylase [Patescibacteria group bacterium]